MNAKQTERKLRELLRQKPKIQHPGRLLAHLAHEIGVEPTSSIQDTIATALIEMNRKGDIELECVGRVIKGVRALEPILSPTPKPGPRPTQPALPQPIPAEQPSAATSKLRLSERDFVDQLNEAFRVLVDAADGDGLGEGLSVRNLLADRTDLKTGRAHRILDFLRGMGYYTTERSGYQQSTYMLDLHKGPVTAAELQVYRLEMSRKLSMNDTTTNVETEAPSAAQNRTEEPTGDVTQAIAPLLDEAVLAEVLVQSEAIAAQRDTAITDLQIRTEEVESLNVALQTAHTETRALEARAERMSVELAEAQQEIAELRAQLAKVPDSTPAVLDRLRELAKGKAVAP